MPQNFFDYTIERLLSFQRQIQELLGSDFPFADTVDVLKTIDEIFKAERERVLSLKENSPEIQKSACSNANLKIQKFLPLLGFILRSTNVRNAFELTDPLVRLSRSLLKKEINFILSSEWDFSPLTYTFSFKELPRAILLGLPTFESGNALIIPLAGHELGHWIWRDENVDSQLSALLQGNVIQVFRDRWEDYQKIFGENQVEKIESDLFIRSVWTISFADALRQCEEIFADFVGLKLFGSSYLDSFEYLLAPSMGEPRSREYPNMRTRARILERAAKSFGVTVPPGYPDHFDELTETREPADQFLIQASDAATEQTVVEIEKHVVALSERLKFPILSPTETNRCVDRMKMGIPAENTTFIANVINAGWIIFKDETLLPEAALGMERRISVLNQLLLKTIEVSEFEARMRGE
jgi:hypothetical protein